MIDIRVRKHDDYSVEFKIGFITDNKLRDINEFRINTWIFVPNGLDINRDTYPKRQFYRDTKTNLRLITPIYSLQDILLENRGPFPRLQRAVSTLLSEPTPENIESYTYQIKMLLCIVKSALRNEVMGIQGEQDDENIFEGVTRFVENIKSITQRYRSFYAQLDPTLIGKRQYEYFLFGDDFLGNIIEQHSFMLLKCLEGRNVSHLAERILLELINAEFEYKKKHNFLVVEKGNKTHNSLVITQRNILKKFVESDLFLQTVKKKDGAFIQQFYYSIAAGIAMIFATVISFFATLRYGNFTTDLFIILVVSYMMKDRIKELARYYFSSQMSRKYFDNKSKLSIRHQEIGWIKEAFDFVGEEKIPEEVMNLRNRTPLVEAENEVYDEKIVMYRKLVNLSREDIEKYKEYRLSGINDITRFNLFHYTQKMDNPTIPLYLPDSKEGYEELDGDKVYSLYFILHCESEENTYYKKFRVLFNRDGISDIKELN